ncbi:MAG: DUF167 domain-containing protein [Candidatus Rokuibacteriota bacterium]|nr:MAG: DUF167 domain-containing protein [Candidatus Rokubacteria bacterium]
MLSLRVQPRASRDEIVGWQDATLRLRVTAPPVAGEANMAVARLLARALGVPPSSISVVRGLRGRDKLVSITGLGEADIRSRLLSHTPRAGSGVSEPRAPVSGHTRSKASSWPLQ